MEFLGEVNNQLVLFFGIGLGSGLLALIRTVIREHRCRIVNEMTHENSITLIRTDISELKSAADEDRDTHAQMWRKISKIEQDISYIRGKMEAQG